jgi:RpiB/LacA/LacB family sugar-phosphate isomerase
MKLEPSSLSPANSARTLVSALEITNLIALTMVFATALGAYATWRTEQVTNQILLISQRPYIGLESIKLVGNTNPRVVEELKNFGTVQAEQTRVRIVINFKETLKARFRGRGHTVEDVCASDIAQGSYHTATDRLASVIDRGRVERGVLICSGAIGASIAANKHLKVRAAFCHETHSVQRGVQDDNMNLLVMEAQTITQELAWKLAGAFVNVAHLRRVVYTGIPPFRLARVVDRIRRNLDKPLEVGELSGLAEMSQSHFSKLFKHSTDLTPHQFILRERINRSKELLRQGKTKIVDVALEVGFQSQAHFTTVFGSLVGMTPRQFQRSSVCATTMANPKPWPQLDHQQDSALSSSAPT